MFDQTVNVEHGGWKYWVRGLDGQVINVQGYSNFQTTAQGDRYGVSVTSSSEAISRVFVQTPHGQNVFDVNNQSFAATPGDMVRLVYVGPDGKNGDLRFAYNASNRSTVWFGSWDRFLPRFRRYFVLAFFWIGFIAAPTVIVRFVPVRKDDDLGFWLSNLSPATVLVLSAIGVGLLAFGIRRYLLNRAIIKKVNDAHVY